MKKKLRQKQKENPISSMSKTSMKSFASLSITAIEINPFLANVPILYPLKHQKIFGFLVFTRGIKQEHLPEMV